MEQTYFLIAFDSTHAAMEAEAYFNEKKIKVKLVPLPSAVSAGCGFAIKILPSEIGAVKMVLKDHQFESASFYKIIRIKTIMKVEEWLI